MASRGARQARRAEAVSLAQCLGHLGVGMEPDVRFGGPPLIARRVVLFREEPGKHLATASREYTAATTLLHLAVAVGAADGSVSDDEIAHLIGHLESGLGLATAERRRLTAHLRWLVTAGVKLTGPKKRIEALDGPQRAAIADQLVAVAGADGVITPDEVTTLTKIFMTRCPRSAPCTRRGPT
jgi:tellurite resistance protein